MVARGRPSQRGMRIRVALRVGGALERHVHHERRDRGRRRERLTLRRREQRGRDAQRLRGRQREHDGVRAARSGARLEHELRAHALEGARLDAQEVRPRPEQRDGDLRRAPAQGAEGRLAARSPREQERDAAQLARIREQIGAEARLGPALEHARAEIETYEVGGRTVVEPHRPFGRLGVEQAREAAFEPREPVETPRLAQAHAPDARDLEPPPRRRRGVEAAATRVGQGDRPERQQALREARAVDQLEQALLARAHQEGRGVEAETLALETGGAPSRARLALEQRHPAAAPAQGRGRRDARETAAHDQHLRCAQAVLQAPPRKAHVVAEPVGFAA